MDAVTSEIDIAELIKDIEETKLIGREEDEEETKLIDIKEGDKGYTNLIVSYKSLMYFIEKIRFVDDVLGKVAKGEAIYLSRLASDYHCLNKDTTHFSV